MEPIGEGLKLPQGIHSQRKTEVPQGKGRRRHPFMEDKEKPEGMAEKEETNFHKR